MEGMRREIKGASGSACSGSGHGKVPKLRVPTAWKMLRKAWEGPPA